MSAVSFLISTFGMWSALRIARDFRDRALISTAHVTKTVTATCAIAILSPVFLSRRPFALVFCVGGALALAFLALKLRERRQIDALKAEVPRFLDHWVLAMKLGDSLSAARQAAFASSTARLRALLEPLFVAGDRARDAHLILDENLRRELLRLASEPHSALARLENTREMIRKADAFRRKSGRARRQTAIQAAVLLILQFALALFTVSRYGIGRSLDLVIWSFLLAALGFGMMHVLSGKRKWTV